jgi:pimeloyl-ACP methyl ester carboxylesterase
MIFIRMIFVFACLLVCTSIICQQKTTVYCFPGQGSDARIFDSIRIDTALFKLVFVEYGTPEKRMSMKNFAYSLINEIDTLNPFVLLGVSLGGMICAELNETLNPRKTILISSAKNRNELPARYRFQKTIPLYQLFPKGCLLVGAKIMQPIVEPDRNKNKETFKDMLNNKNAAYMKRTIRLIINWDRKDNSKKVYQIHGNNDHTLPLRKIKNPDFIVENGSHMMTLTRGTEISCILNDILATNYTN